MNFAINRFGNDDTITASQTLYMGFDRQNDKIGYVTIPYPKQTVNEENIKDVMNYILDNKIIFDKDGDSFTSIATAYTEDIQKISYDLT